MQPNIVRVLAVGLANDPPPEWTVWLKAADPAIEITPFDPDENLQPTTRQLESCDVVIAPAEQIVDPRLRQALDTIHGEDRDLEILVILGAKAQQPAPGDLPEYARRVWISPGWGNDLRRSAESGKRLRMLSRLANMASWINSTMDINEILKRTCQIVVSLFNVDHSGLVEFSQDQVYGWTAAEYPEDLLPHATVGGRIQVKGIPVEEALVWEKKIQAIADLEAETGLGEVGEMLRFYGIRSILLCPIIVEGRVIASFSLDLIHSQRKFSDLEIDLCKKLAELAAVALDNARLYEENKSSQLSLKALFHSAQAMLPNREPREVIQSAVDNVHHEMKTWGTSVLILGDDETRDDWVTAGYKGAEDRVRRFRREPGVTLQVYRSGEPRFVADTQLETIPENYHPNMIEDGVRSFACLPLKAHGRTHGVMWVHYREPHPFRDTDRDAFGYFAKSLASTYANAKWVDGWVRKATQVMNAADRPKILRKAVVEGACELLSADIAVLWPYEASKKRLRPEDLAAAGLAEDVVDRLHKIDPGSEMTAAWTGEHGMRFSRYPVPLEEVLEPRLALLLNETELRGGYKVVGLEAGDSLLGVLFVGRQIPLEDDEINSTLLNEFAGYAAATLARGEISQHSDSIAAAGREIIRVSAGGDLRATLKTIVKKARELVRCSIATLYVYDPDRQTFIQHVAYGKHSPRNVLPPERLDAHSSPYRLLELPENWHAAEDAAADPIFNGGFVRAEKICSAAGLVLRYADTVVGVMFVNFKQEYRFGKNDEEDLKQFARSAAIVIHSYLKESARRQKAREALRRAEQEINRLVGEKHSLQDTLTMVCIQALEMLPDDLRVHGCLSHFALSDQRTLRFAAAVTPAKLRSLKKKIGDIDLYGEDRVGIVGRCALGGGSLRIADVQAHPDYIEYDIKVKSQLSVPVRSGTRVIGVLSIEHPALNAFSFEDEQNLEMLAALAGVAIANNRRMTLLQSLLQAGDSLTTNRELEAALETIGEAVRSVFNCDLVSTYSYNKNDREISYPPVVRGELKNEAGLYRRRPSRPNSRRMPLDDLGADKSVIPALIAHGKPIFAKDTAGDPILGRGGFWKREEVASTAALPLVTDRGCVGLLFINYRSQHDFSEEEELEIKLYAHYAAIAIETARKHADLSLAKGMVGARTALAWMSTMRSAWTNSVIAHSFTTKDSLALLSRRLENSRLSEDTRDLVEEQIRSIEEGADKLLKLPSTPPLFAEDGEKRIFDLNAFCEKLISRYELELSHRGEKQLPIELVCSEEKLAVCASEDWLFYALRYLLEDLRQSMEGGRRSTINIVIERVGPAKDRVAVSLYPNPRKARRSLKWQEIGEPAAVISGLQTGLLTVQAVAEAYQGKVEIEAAEDLPGGRSLAAVRIVLPLFNADSKEVR